MLSLKPTLGLLASDMMLSERDAHHAVDVIMRGAATPPQIAAFLRALRMRGETVAEMVGAVRAMRSHMTTVDLPAGAIDIVGTGGDAAGTLNISTATAIVVAACGVPVAKHGNRAQSSKSGTADVLAALGVNTDLPPETVPRALEQAGITFLLAPNYHPALRHAAGPRAKLGVRTLFNLVAPLANPARVRRQLTGAYSADVLRPMAEASRDLGTEHAWFVHGQGLDELTISGPSQVVEVDRGVIREFVVAPSDCGLASAPIEALQGGSPHENARALVDLLAGKAGVYRDCVLFNAAAALLVAGACGTLQEGACLAARAVDAGRAAHVLEKLRVATSGGPSDAALLTG